MNRKGRRPRRNYQALRDDASPRGVNCIFLLRRGSRGFAGLAPHFGRSPFPHSFVLCSGVRKTSLSPPGPKASRQPGKYRENNKSCQHGLLWKIRRIFLQIQARRSRSVPIAQEARFGAQLGSTLRRDSPESRVPTASPATTSPRPIDHPSTH